MFSSSDEVYVVSISRNYIILSVTYSFSLGKWARIEGNDCKLLRVKTSLVDWSVCTWAQWVCKTIRQNRIGFSYIFSWKVELLQHAKMKCNNKFYWYVKSFHLAILFQPNHLPQLVNTITKLLVEEIENLWHMHHVWNAMSIISYI